MSAEMSTRWRLSPKKWLKQVAVWREVFAKAGQPMTLREWMIREGLTQPDVADALGTSQQMISNYMRSARNPPVDMLLKIEEITGGEVTIHGFTLDAKEAGDRRLFESGLLPEDQVKAWERVRASRASADSAAE